MPKIDLHEKWLAQPYQHGRRDTCDGGSSFETEAEAVEYAKNWCEEIPHDEKTEHEMVIFKAVAAYRGRTNTPIKYGLK